MRPCAVSSSGIVPPTRQRRSPENGGGNGPERYPAACLPGGACRPSRARRRVLGPSWAARRKSLGEGRREALRCDWRREDPGEYGFGGTAPGERVREDRKRRSAASLERAAPTPPPPSSLLVLSLREGAGSEFAGTPAQFDTPLGRRTPVIGSWNV